MASNLLFIVVKKDVSIFDEERVEVSDWLSKSKISIVSFSRFIAVLALSKSFVAYFIALKVVTSNRIECPSSMIGMTSLPCA